jgi:ComF family protein
MSFTTRTAAAFLQLLAPARCPGCDGLLALGPVRFCAACEPLLELPPESLRAPHPGAAAFSYGGPLADALLRFKYAARTDLAGVLGELLAEASLPVAGRVERVLPLPLHPARLRARGFNQSALLAAPVARALGSPLDCDALRRIRPTRDQAGLPRVERANNVRGAFAARALPGARVLLIDDVRTTGATLAAAGEALLHAGASEVRSLVLARAEG